MSSFEVRELRRKDIPYLGAIHREVLPDDYLPRLGRRFLESYFFPFLLQAKSARTFVYLENEKPVGFLVACVDRRRFMRDLKGYRPAHLAFYLLSTSLRNWRIFLSTLETLVRGPGGIREIPGELYLIAVGRTAQRRGVGSVLVRYLASYLSEARLQRCQVKVAANDIPANSFYERNGFQVVRTLRYHGRWWNWRVAEMETLRSFALLEAARQTAV